MPFGTPADPVPNTVITVAYAVANILDPIRWLRRLTGNADPPGSDYVAASTSTSLTAWSKVSGPMLGSGAVVAHLGYTPANAAGDTFTGGVSAPSLTSTTTISAGTSLSVGASATITGALVVNNTTPNSIVTHGGMSIDGDVASLGRVTGASFSAITSIGAIAAGGQLSTSNTGANSIQTPGGASIGLSLGVGGGISAGSGISATGNVGGFQLVTACPPGTPPIVTNSPTLVDNLNCLLHNGYRASVTPSAGYIPVADASGKLDAWITPSGGGGGTVTPIPTGLIAFISDAALPTGWTFYTALNGRVLIGAGTASVTNPQSFTVGTSYGPDWGHAHSSNSFGVTVGGTASGGPEDNTGGATGVRTGLNVTSGPGSEDVVGSHTHGLNGVSFAVSASGTATGATTAAIWIPPSHALNAIKKS